MSRQSIDAGFLVVACSLVVWKGDGACFVERRAANSAGEWSARWFSAMNLMAARESVGVSV